MPEPDDIQTEYDDYQEHLEHQSDIGDIVVTVQRPRTDLAPVASEQQAADSHPARVYLLRLAPSSRPVMRGALNIAADMLTGGQCTWETIPWSGMRIQHMDAL